MSLREGLQSEIQGGVRDGDDEDRGDEDGGIGELRELPILVLGGTGEKTLM